MEFGFFHTGEGPNPNEKRSCVSSLSSYFTYPFAPAVGGQPETRAMEICDRMLSKVDKLEKQLEDKISSVENRITSEMECAVRIHFEAIARVERTFRTELKDVEDDIRPALSVLEHRVDYIQEMQRIYGESVRDEQEECRLALLSFEKQQRQMMSNIGTTLSQESFSARQNVEGLSEKLQRAIEHWEKDAQHLMGLSQDSEQTQSDMQTQAMKENLKFSVQVMPVMAQVEVSKSQIQILCEELPRQPGTLSVPDEGSGAAREAVEDRFEASPQLFLGSSPEQHSPQTNSPDDKQEMESVQDDSVDSEMISGADSGPAKCDFEGNTVIQVF